jgi:hypothetical protein
MTRDEIHSSFVRLFAKQGKEGTVKIEELTQIEVELSISFPEAYVAFITKYGAIFTPSILDLVTGGESEIAPDGASWDVQEFFNAPEIVKTSQLMWSGGMESYLVPIAMDCMGNVFGFHRRQNLPRPGDSPVLFFDHDFCKIHEEAASFDNWLSSFIRLSAT